MTRKLCISAVRAIDSKHALEIEWNDGKRDTVYLFNHINSFAVLIPLRDLEKFSQVKVDEWGLGLTWGKELELSLVTLFRLLGK